jgi:threonine efflux protein
MENFWLFALIHMLGIVSPGQSFIGITRYSLKNSLKDAYKYVLGVSLAEPVYVALTLFGISGIILQNKIGKNIFYISSASYLFYLAFCLFRSKKFELSTDGKTNKNPVKSGFMIAITNPKVPIFYSVLFAQFLTAEMSFGLLLFILIYTTIATFVFFCLVAKMFYVFREKILKYMFYLEKVFGLCLFYLGLKLLIDLF